MATILLSAAGAALGGSIGGTVAGLSTAIIGRAIGATVGRVIDQRLMGAGSEAVEQGRVDRFRLSNVGDGSPATQVFGRMRVGGQVIWASDFQESVTTTGGGGKGAPSQPAVSQYSYSVSLAVALCAGEINSVGRIWADGEEISREDLGMRVYTGAPDQLPDPLIEAIEGTGLVPAYRGTAYVVFENLALDPFGNRVPQFSFEVVRGEQPDGSGYGDDPAQSVRGVALVPGTGEYSLATTPVYYAEGQAAHRAANVNSPSGATDLVTSIAALGEEVPNCSAVSLVVSWFGDDLRVGNCTVQPKVETDAEGSMPWSVAGVTRGGAVAIDEVEGRPIYGGTPSDDSVVEAIRHLNEVGQGVMFYPFILMDQQDGNGLPDPWTGAADQPALPWRGRITLSTAPGRDGSPDRTAAAATEVDAFFGTATAADFTVGDGTVTYTGPAEWGLRRFILHYAALCAAAGGVEAFCIASEMRSLTQIRGAEDEFVAVTHLRDLADEVRSLLGAETKIGYAADWSEYFGYQPQDGSGDLYFHLDPLWADANIDFIGIDNYMPLSDWRDGEDHLDRATAGAIHDLDYLRANIEGGELFDWYYASDGHRSAQIRTPISDQAYDKPWVYRPKDIHNWWNNRHMPRVLGVEGVSVLDGNVGSNYSMYSGTETPDYAVDDMGNSATRVEHANATNSYYTRTNLPATTGATYRLIVRMKTTHGGTQTTHLNIYDGSHNRKPVTVTGDYQTFVHDVQVSNSSINAYPSDPRGGGGSPDCDLLISRAVLARVDETTEWVPASKPIWFTELGCAAIDKGTNQPNKFLDPKSSESALPYFSSGARDDLIQSQYLRAMLGYWAQSDHNPVSEVYGGPMIDLAHAYVWAWDARPFPAFPNAVDTWSDGENYPRGHWINGRIGGRTLASVVEEICRLSGVEALDLSELHGFVRGFVIEDVGEARAALQPLMLRYGFDAVERDGLLKMIPRDGQADHLLAHDTLAESGEMDSLTELTRAGEAEMTGRIRLRFLEADGDHAVLAEEAIHPEDATHAVATSDLPLAMTRGEGRAVADRWLAEARVSRDTLRLALPLSQIGVRAGDVVHLPDENGGPDVPYRVDRVELAEAQLIEAVRIEPEVYRPTVIDDQLVPVSGFVPPLPVTPLFLDLPLIAGDEVEHAPHLTVTAQPWSGSAAVYTSASDEAYELERILTTRAVAGVTESPLLRHASGRWDRGEPLQVRLISGALESRPTDAILNGANLAAIGDGSSGNWELFQFETADLVGSETYWLSGRLRGQLGSDGLMPDVWPEGSWFVLLNGTPEQISLSPSQLRLNRHFRIGPADRPYSDPSYTHVAAAFDGNGLRPYAPAHLVADRVPGGDLAVSFIRRTRIDGDSWDLAEVPLGEESESYVVRVRSGSTVLREVTLASPAWTYSAADQAADGVLAGDVIEVAQLSARYGPGLFAEVAVPA